MMLSAYSTEVAVNWTRDKPVGPVFQTFRKAFSKADLWDCIWFLWSAMADFSSWTLMSLLASYAANSDFLAVSYASVCFLMASS